MMLGMFGVDDGTVRPTIVGTVWLGGAGAIGLVDSFWRITTDSNHKFIFLSIYTSE